MSTGFENKNNGRTCLVFRRATCIPKREERKKEQRKRVVACMFAFCMSAAHLEDLTVRNPP